MNELKVFSSKEFGGIRAFEKDGQPWFDGKDVASVLGYENTTRTVGRFANRLANEVVNLPGIEIEN